jgi:hypothetical protein
MLNWALEGYRLLKQKDKFISDKVVEETPR